VSRRVTDYAVFERVERTGSREWTATSWVVTLGAEGSPTVHSPSVHSDRSQAVAVTAVRAETARVVDQLRRLGVLPSVTKEPSNG
jgi:hypothetical protein